MSRTTHVDVELDVEITEEHPAELFAEVRHNDREATILGDADVVRHITDLIAQSQGQQELSPLVEMTGIADDAHVALYAAVAHTNARRDSVGAHGVTNAADLFLAWLRHQASHEPEVGL